MNDFRVIALVAARNEEDIIAQVLEDLIRQRIDVFLIDDGSTDGTVSEASQWLGRGLLEIERHPPNPVFEWARLLRRKQELAARLDAHWFLHHDADEFRESPWAERDLLDAFREVDRLGYDAVDFRVLNFWPTEDGLARGADVREAFQFYEIAPARDAVQIKAWKRTSEAVDLVSSGGHEAAFANRRVFPIPFLTRHYPVRSQAHGARKIFTERLPRFSSDERAQGWHVQYDDLTAGTNFVRDPAQLTKYDPERVRNEMLLDHKISAMDAVAEVAALVGKLSLIEGDISALREQVSNLQTELGLERAAAEARQRAAANELAAARMAAAAQREDDARRIQLLDKELAAVYASMSWKVTGPLRIVYGAILRAVGAVKQPEA